MVAIWPFLKKVFQKSNDLVIWPFFNAEENSIFKSLVWRDLSKICNII